MSSTEICSTCGKLAFIEETVTIPASEYRELLERATVPPLRWKAPQSPIARDEEVRDFIVSLAKPGKMRATDIREAVLERFGPDRTPSRSALHRFLNSSIAAQRAAAKPER